MATNILWRKRLLLDGSEFEASGADNLVKLYASNINGDVGAEIGSLTYEGDGGWWYIEIDIETKHNGYYILRYSTNAGVAWTTIDKNNDSGEPIMINNEPIMLLSGGTMTGAIAMGDNSVTGANNISFNDTAGTVAGIANGNLIDKTADETITGAWTFSGDCALTGKNEVTGITSFAADKCLIDSVIAQPYHFITKTWHGVLANDDIAGILFTCDTKITLVSIFECHSANSTNGADLYVERLSDTEAIGSGDIVNNAFDLENDAVDTVHSDKTLANASFTIGDRIGVYVDGDEAVAADVHLTIVFRYGD